MDSSYGRSRRSRAPVTCRRRGGTTSTDTSNSDADTDEDPEHGGVRISPGWPTMVNRHWFRQRLNPRDPLSRTRYRTRERSRSPVTPSPPATRMVSPVVSLSRMPNLDALLSAGRVSWAPASWSSGNDPLVNETSGVVNTQNSASSLGDSDSFSTPTTIRIVRRTIPSTEEEEDDVEHQGDADDEGNNAEDDLFTQVVENMENSVALDLFDTSDDDEDDDDDDLELAGMYDVNLNHDFSEAEGDDDRTWSAITPSEDETDTTVYNPSEASTSTHRPIPPVTAEDGPLAGTLMELLECPVCYEPMQPPIWQCSRGHLVCRDCAPKLRRCPTCRCAAQRTRNCTLEKVSSALRYPCRNRHRGCTVHSPPAQLTPHEERECAYRDASCRVQSCSWRGEPNTAAAHARAAHAGLTRMLQLGRPVIMGVSVPTSSGQRVTRVLRLVDSDRVFFVHLQLNNRPNVAQWCSYVQEFGQETVNDPLAYRLDLDEEGAAEKRLVRPDVVNEVVALIIRGSGRKVDERPDDERLSEAWRNRTYRAKVYTRMEIPDESPESSRTRCFSYGQIKKGFYISNSGSIKVRIIVTLWATPAARTTHDAGDLSPSTITSTATSPAKSTATSTATSSSRSTSTSAAT